MQLRSCYAYGFWFRKEQALTLSLVFPFLLFSLCVDVHVDISIYKTFTEGCSAFRAKDI